MTRFVNLKLGKLIQFSGLQYSNPLQLVTLYQFASETVDNAGQLINVYNQVDYEARIQSVEQEMMFKYSIEIGKVVKRFYLLLDDAQTANRSIATTGDFIKYNNLFWRILHIPDAYVTGWNEIIAEQTDVVLL